MEFFDSTNNNDNFNSIYTNYFTTDAITTVTSGTACTTDLPSFAQLPFIVVPDKDWMPYRHFEYQPLWHKKYASIKYQMETMWD